MHAPAPASLHKGDIGPRSLIRALGAYREPKTARSVAELAVTAGGFAALWLLTYFTLAAGHLWGLLFAVPAGGLLLRLFLIQHDCGHGAFFRRRAANDWVGRILGVVTFTPYESWRQAHNSHHASTGNLGARGVGDIDTLTVAEFRALSRPRRALYRLYRHPLVLFGLGPAYMFLVRHRLPIGRFDCGWAQWISAVGTNLGIAAVAGGLCWLMGPGLFFLVHIPIALVAATAGMWFFYVQHQFERTNWDKSEDWSFHEAALYGSSHYELPAVLRWVSANVGIHHVHHLASRIPFYRLSEVVRDLPAFAGTSCVTLRESFRYVRLALWDEDKRQLVSFAQARR